MAAELELSYGKAMSKGVAVVYEPIENLTYKPLRSGLSLQYLMISSQLQFTPKRLWLTDAGRLYDSITSLQTAVLVITVVIGILCVLETIAIIYRILIEGRQSQRYSEYLERYRRQSRRTSRSGRMRSTTSASRSSRSADRRHRPSKTKSRDGAKKLKRSKPNEPSKTSTVRISLDHEEDDSVPKETPAEKRYRSRSRSTSDSGKEQLQSEPYGAPEQVNADIRELAQEKGDGWERVKKDSRKGDVKIDIEQDKARKSSDSGADSAHETGIRIKDSLVAASAPPNYVAVSDKDLDSAAKKTPGSPQQQSPAHLFGDQHNDVKPVAKDSLNQVGDKNFVPVAEL
ncbi:unnamed protein product, partial [Anisakis simplex]|uniref:Uncharacterized protein n=1 Tax=Anisakis simplex TaxID=6269 RepID=A0A0M3J0Q6_ANISI